MNNKLQVVVGSTVIISTGIAFGSVSLLMSKDNQNEMTLESLKYTKREYEKILQDPHNIKNVTYQAMTEKVKLQVEIKELNKYIEQFEQWREIPFYKRITIKIPFMGEIIDDIENKSATYISIMSKT